MAYSEHLFGLPAKKLQAAWLENLQKEPVFQRTSTYQLPQLAMRGGIWDQALEKLSDKQVNDVIANQGKNVKPIYPVTQLLISDRADLLPVLWQKLSLENRTLLLQRESTLLETYSDLGNQQTRNVLAELYQQHNQEFALTMLHTMQRSDR